MVSGRIYTFPAGVYYVGDPCFIMKEEMYEVIACQTDYMDGLYAQDKYRMLLGRTHRENGTYSGSDAFDYTVDSGMIGIISMSLADGDVGDLAKMHKFLTDAYIKIEGGVFTITCGSSVVVIDTAECSESDGGGSGGSCDMEVDV
jgi:hypothetical protein